MKITTHNGQLRALMMFAARRPAAEYRAMGCLAVEPDGSLIATNGCAIVVYASPELSVGNYGAHRDTLMLAPRPVWDACKVARKRTLELDVNSFTWTAKDPAGGSATGKLLLKPSGTWQPWRVPFQDACGRRQYDLGPRDIVIRTELLAQLHTLGKAFRPAKPQCKLTVNNDSDPVLFDYGTLESRWRLFGLLMPVLVWGQRDE